MGRTEAERGVLPVERVEWLAIRIAGEKKDSTDSRIALARARHEGRLEGLEEAAKRVEGGRFLHDDAPVAKWAREVATAIRALALPEGETRT